MFIAIEEYSVFIFRVWKFPLPWPEDGDSLFFLYVRKLQPSNTASHLREQQSSQLPDLTPIMRH
jgi:hypothetical protein